MGEELSKLVTTNIKQEDIFNVLVVIDLQKQFRDENGEYEKCIGYVKKRFEDSYILGTIFTNFNDSMYEKHLKWSGCKDVDYTDIEYPYHHLLLKRSYGINQNDGFVHSLGAILEFAEKQQNSCVPKIKYQLIGCDADACVLASAFELWDKGYDFEILSDYIYTTAEDIDKNMILKIMKRNFGDCVK